MGFLDKIDKMMNKDEKVGQLQGELNSLQLRKESIVSAIQGEISQLQNEKNSVFCKAGMKAYENWSQGNSDASGLAEFWNKVKELDQAIKEKQEKKAEMEARYDEEIGLIQTNLNLSMAAASGGKVCPSCKAVAKEGDLFCEKCGTRLG